MAEKYDIHFGEQPIIFDEQGVAHVTFTWRSPALGRAVTATVADPLARYDWETDPVDVSDVMRPVEDVAPEDVGEQRVAVPDGADEQVVAAIRAQNERLAASVADARHAAEETARRQTEQAHRAERARAIRELEPREKLLRALAHYIDAHEEGLLATRSAGAETYSALAGLDLGAESAEKSPREQH